MFARKKDLADIAAKLKSDQEEIVELRARVKKLEKATNIGTDRAFSIDSFWRFAFVEREQVTVGEAVSALADYVGVNITKTDGEKPKVVLEKKKQKPQRK